MKYGMKWMKEVDILAKVQGQPGSQQSTNMMKNRARSGGVRFRVRVTTHPLDAEEPAFAQEETWEEYFQAHPVGYRFNFRHPQDGL